MEIPGEIGTSADLQCWFRKRPQTSFPVWGSSGLVYFMLRQHASESERPGIPGARTSRN